LAQVQQRIGLLAPEKQLFVTHGLQSRPRNMFVLTCCTHAVQQYLQRSKL